MNFRNSQLFKVLSLSLILSVTTTQNFIFAGESLTATMAAQNSHSVRSEIRKSVGLFNKSLNVGLSIKTTPQPRSELRQSEWTGTASHENPTDFRSELRQYSFDPVQIGVGAVIALGAVAFRILLKRMTQKLALNSAINVTLISIREFLRKRDVDPAIELKWLDLVPSAKFLAQSASDNDHFDEKLELLIQLILKIRILLEPNPGGIGYQKAIETGRRRATYDILPLLEQAWRLKQSDTEFRVELQPYYSHDTHTHIPFLAKNSTKNSKEVSEVRSELRTGSFDLAAPTSTEAVPALLLSREIIRRFVEVKRDIAGVKINLRSATLFTQYRNKDFMGHPVSDDFLQLSREWQDLFPAAIDGQSLNVIDVIPSEEFLVGLIKRDDEESYAQLLSDALVKLFSSKSVALLTASLRRNDRRTFRIPDAPRFEVRIGHYAQQPGVYINIFIHPETSLIPGNYKSIASEMLRRFSDHRSADQIPEAVDLLQPDPEHETSTSLVSVYPTLDKDGRGRKIRYERRFVEVPGNENLIPPMILIEGSEQRLVSPKYLGLHHPETESPISYSTVLKKGLNTELASILDRVKEFRFSVVPGGTLVNFFETSNFRVNVLRFRDGVTYVVNIYFRSPRLLVAGLQGGRSELRLTAVPELVDMVDFHKDFMSMLKSEFFLKRTFDLAKFLSAHRESDSAFIVSRELAFDKGLLPVFAAMVEQGIPVAIIAPSEDLDRNTLIESVNQALSSGRELIAADTLQNAAKLLRIKAQDAQLIFIKGDQELVTGSEIDFKNDYHGDIKVMSDREIKELEMSVRGLLSLKEQVRAIYDSLHRFA